MCVKKNGYMRINFQKTYKKDIVVVFIDKSLELAIEDKECILLKELPKDIPFK